MTLLRSPREIAFRLKQETANLWLLASKPLPNLKAAFPLAGLPDAIGVVHALRGSRFESDAIALAEELLRHRFPLLGLSIETGPHIDWSKDYVSGASSGDDYFRRIPYLDVSRVGDHKIIWELNRHQHLVVLAQAFRFTGRSEFLQEIVDELSAWWDSNPFMRGINWASALEVAFRALSWTWVLHLTGEFLESGFRERFLAEIYRHGLYLEYNLSVYFSPNTHLLGEAVALHALGVLFPEFPRARRWQRLGGRLVLEQMHAQVRNDGSHFEQSSYYHLYAVDFFVFHQVLTSTPQAYQQRLECMAEYLAAVLGPSRRLPFIGDDDGGRLFHPYGCRDGFGRATLATCGVLMSRPEWIVDPADLQEQALWWLGNTALQHSGAPSERSVFSHLFPDSGTVVMLEGEVQVVIDTGTFGYGTAGHSHSDTLSIVVRRGGCDVLIDPGTYTYVADPRWRNWFRGAAAHNTLRADGLDQALAQGTFRWRDKPDTKLLNWTPGAGYDFVDAECTYAGFTHRRSVLFVKQLLLLIVLDTMYGPEGEHIVEQFWHTGKPLQNRGPSSFQIGESAGILLLGDVNSDSYEGGEHGWRSLSLGQMEPAPVIRASRVSTLPVYFGTILDLTCDSTLQCSMAILGDEVRLALRGIHRRGTVKFSAQGIPEHDLR